MVASASKHAFRWKRARADEPRFELLAVAAGLGLTRLPEPSDADIFLDLV
jgi:hypothetical protein